jgi:hypothetical protein
MKNGIALPPGVLQQLAAAEPLIEFDGYHFRKGTVPPIVFTWLAFAWQARRGLEPGLSICKAFEFSVIDANMRHYWPMEVDKPAVIVGE